MNERWVVSLEDWEQEQLLELTSKGKIGARKMKRAQILLMADDGATDEEIAASLPVGSSTVYRTKRRLVEGGKRQCPQRSTTSWRKKKDDRQARRQTDLHRVHKASRRALQMDP